jgi:hypothetical protein
VDGAWLWSGVSIFLKGDIKSRIQVADYEG